QDAPLPHPEVRKRQNQILEVQALRLTLKFYFSFQVVSRNSLVCSLRSTCCSIQSSAASRNSFIALAGPGGSSSSSNRLLAKTRASPRPDFWMGRIRGLRQLSQLTPPDWPK